MKITWPILFLYDLFVLPLINIGPVGFRLSYIAIGVMGLKHLVFGANRIRRERNVILSIPFLAFLLIVVTTIGHYFLVISHDVSYGYEAFRSIVHITFMALAYVAGRNISKFNFADLHKAFIVVIVVNLFFTIGTNWIPDVIFSLYFPEKLLSGSFAESYGISSIDALRSWYRPLGPHGSPTYSAFAVNIFYLFYVVAHLNQSIFTEKLKSRLMILLMPLILSLFYASRTEMIASGIISLVIYYHWYAKKPLWVYNVSFMVKIILATLLIYIGISYLIRDLLIEVTFVDLIRILDFIDNPLSGGASSAEGAGGGGEIRSTFMFESAWNRFIVSPLFGTGLGQGSERYLDTVWFYHNDVFYIFVSSGIIGALIYVALIVRHVLPMHSIMVLPFLLPGLTNSFLLVFPMVIAYFYMLGIFKSNKVINKPTL